MYLLHKSQNNIQNLSNLNLMNWQDLYQEQLYKNRELKKQLEIVESILRDYLPIVENSDDMDK